MPMFIVSVKEVHVQPYEVEAPDKDAAIKVVQNGGNRPDDVAFPPEYSHTLDPEFWTVEEVPEEVTQADLDEQVDIYERQLRVARLAFAVHTGKAWRAYKTWCLELGLDSTDSKNETRFAEIEKKIREET